MQKITPHLWFDKEAKEATAFYTSLFPNSQVNNVTTITDTPSGDCDIVTFTLSGQEFMAISAGPYFKLNSSISLFTTFDTEEEIEAVWNKLADGGKVLMPYNSYPWATKYGWLEDKYGVSWQLSMSEHHATGQKITPLLMFTQDLSGKTKEAVEFYTNLLDGKEDMLVPFEEGEGGVTGHIKHARFSLFNQNFMAMDGGASHAFRFNEAFSLIIHCDTQDEIDHYWGELSKVPESEQCGWCKDKYGVSWQIVPRIMGTMMTTGTKEQVARVTQAFLPMKKFDIKKLEEAFNK